ncbi:MAG: hypothetical protein H8D87_07385 [Deltaproteobacteria bacterium]|uniref:hypothetical protein n=1 Tax=Desulfobacula sp. TaxID=2593537 RepID=UPI001995F0D2|nr:hypothetical protein [Candidatus Desulfobacula maris]MBL6994537.1 hypothetical protein [Desulfobacula sp.]
MSTIIKGQNLDDYNYDLQKYNVIVTYNGKIFPFIENHFRTNLNHATGSKDTIQS